MRKRTWAIVGCGCGGLFLIVVLVIAGGLLWWTDVLSIRPSSATPTLISAETQTPSPVVATSTDLVKIASPTATITPEPTDPPTLTPEPVDIIAFQAKAGSISEIFVMNPDGINLRNLTPSLAGSFEPSLSPDGKQVVFWSREDGNPDLWLVNVDSRDPTQLTQTGLAELCPVWSPDGTRIAYQAILFFGAFLEDPDAAGIWVTTADGSYTEQIVGPDLHSNPGCPSWSPSGDRLAFSSSQGGEPDGRIFIINTDGTGLVELFDFVSEENSVQEVSWSPDGTQIVFEFGHLASSEREQEAQIYIINIDNPADPIQLTTEGAVNQCPSWSPDGSRILFSSNRGGDHDLYSMNPDGSDQKPLLVIPGDEFCPVWVNTP